MRHRTSTGGVLLAAAAALAASACGGEPDRGREGRRALPGDSAGLEAVTPARYVTDVTFAPFRPDARRLHFRFRHTTGADRLERRYGAWRLGADRWRPLLSVHDTMPVPRAGWRVLPADGLRVVAGRGGGLAALVRRDSSGPVRLDLGRTLARWESPTGQTERFRRAALVSGAGRVPGLAVERRSAVARDAAPRRGLYGFLLVADSTGEGLVILRHGGTPAGRRPPEVDTTAVAHAWTSDGPQTWTDVRLASARDTAGAPAGGLSSPGGWRVEIPAGGIRGRLTPGPVRELPGSGEGRDAASAGRRPVRLYGLSGTLTVHGETRRVRGVGVEAGEP